MTSKEKLQHLAFNWCLRNEGDNRLSYHKEKELFDSLMKDLGVLAILKKHKKIPLSRVEQYINNSQKYGWTTKDHPLSVYDIDYTEEEFSKVKEWLKK